MTLAVSLSAEPSRAHVDVRPRIVEQGAVTDVVVELPGLDRGPKLVRVEVAGEGVETLSARPAGSLGVDALWSVRLRVTAPPGPLTLVLRPFYADGGSAEFEQRLTVVPPEGGSFPWGAAIAGTGAVLAGALGALVVLRRRA
jgi:hypothetical protein